MNTAASPIVGMHRPQRLPWAAALVAAPLLALILTLNPLPVLLLTGLVIGTMLVGRNVDWATYVVLFVIYSNIAVVAVKYHNVPSIAANGVIGLLAIPLGFLLVIRREPIVLGPCFPWIIAMAVVQLLGAVFARQPELAWEELQTFLLEGVLLYLLVVNVVRTSHTLRGATWALLVAGCLIGSVPLWQQLTGTFDNDYGGLAQTGDEPGFTTGDDDSPQLRLSGSIGEKNRYAQIMLMLVPLALFRLRDESQTILKFCAGCALLFALAGVYLTFSRSSIVAGGIVVALAAWWRHVNRKAVVIVFAAVLLGLLATPEYRARLSSLVDLKELFIAGKHSEADGALKGRATEMGAAALVFLDHPLVGVGPGQFRYYSREYGERIGIRALTPERQAHCLPLDVAAENGLLGLICLVAIFTTLGYGLGRCVRDSHRNLETQGVPATYLYMLAVYGATGLFLHFAFIRYFWVMIALGTAALEIHRTLAQECNARSPELEAA